MQFELSKHRAPASMDLHGRVAMHSNFGCMV